MAIPTNPSLNEEWTNDATGVTYKWDGDRWFVISTEAADNAATYVKKAGDTMTGELLFDGGNNIMVMNDQALRLKSSRDDNPNSSATHVTVGRNGDGDAITGIYHLQRPQQPEWAVNMEYSDEKDQLLQDQIDDALETQAEIQGSVDTLENKVEALEGTVVDGKWYAESRSTPRTGGFDITTGGLQSMSDWEADYLRVHKTDSTGKVFTFAEVGIGDYVRIGAAGSSAVYKIVDVISGSLDWQTFEVELVNSTGTPMPDLTYDFEFLPSFDPSAYATIQYVDAQDDLAVKLADVNDVSIGFRIKNGGNTLISTATEGKLGLYHVKDPSDGNGEWAATKGYVDDQIAAIPTVDLDDYLPLVGGDMTGRIDITLSDPALAAIRTIGSINVKADSQQLGQANNFIAHKDYVRVYSTPSGPQDVVNKEYAEGHFAAKSHTHDYKKAALWKAVSPSTAAGDLQVGEFFVADNNNIYLNPKSANGVDLGISGTTEYSQSMTYLASIHGSGTYNSMYSTVADKINFNVSSNNYIRVQSSHLLYKQAMTVGTNYVINIPGFTP